MGRTGEGATLLRARRFGRIYLLRTENGQQTKIPFDYKDVVKGNHPEQNIQLKPGDTIVVP